MLRWKMLSVFIVLTVWFAHAKGDYEDVLPLIDEACSSLKLCRGAGQPFSAQWAAKVSASLSGQGSHRQLQYNIVLSHQLGSACATAEVVLLQPLQPETFVDPYELTNLERKSGVARYKVLGGIDLEQPAYLCNATLLVVELPAAALAPTAVSFNVSVPLHAKYLKPFPQHPTSWYSWHLAGWHSVQLPQPFLMVRCASPDVATDHSPEPSAPTTGTTQDKGGVGDSAIADPGLAAEGTGVEAGLQGAELLESGKFSVAVEVVLEGPMPVWQMPAGNSIHQHVVQLGTGLATALCCVCTAWAAWHQSKQL